MRTGAIPFRFDITELIARVRQLISSHLGDPTINLPFVSIPISFKNRERQVACEILIRLKDRRILSASECCDNCIDNALRSLQEIRSMLLDKQVDLLAFQDGPLYLLIDFMITGIRQFLTYEELLKNGSNMVSHPRFGDFQRPPDVRQAYFDALEVLRGHLSRCLGQIAVIAGAPVPTEGIIANYRGPWQLEAYVNAEIPSK